MTNELEGSAGDRRIKRANEIQAAIRRIFMEDWDPIEVRGVPEAASEYDAYIGPVYRLIASGAGALRLADELAEDERRMGLNTPPARLLEVARPLHGLDVRLEPEDPAL